MTSLINASNSAGVIITSDTSGNLAIQSAGNTVATISATGANAGIQVASWAAPAFAYYANAGQSLAATTATKLLYGAKEFDTANAVSSSTFTPQVAGYYQINAQMQPNASYTGGWICIYKNGSAFKYGNFCISTSFGGWMVSSIVYCNGSTDYIEIYGYLASAQAVGSGPFFTYFNGAMVRSA